MPADFTNRLRSLIQLRLKDVRGEEQTAATAMRPLKQGGLGLSAAQAGELIKACAASLQRDAPTPAQRALMVEPEELPAMYAESPTPAVAAPHNAFVRARPAIAPSLPAPPAAAPAPVSVSRPLVSDITGKPSALGPIDEIRYFTLIDFRRLASNPGEAASRLEQKLVNLKEESYLLYMDAAEAWKESPLFASYMSAVQDALRQRRRLADVLSGPDKIRWEEIRALLTMEMELS